MQEIIPFIGVPCFLVFCFCIYKILKTKKQKQKIQRSFIILAAVSFLATGGLVSLTEDNTTKEASNEKVSTDIKKDKEEDKPKKAEKKLTEDEKLTKEYIEEYHMSETLAKSFLEQCKNVKIDPSKISKITNNSDGAGEVGITFTTNNANFVANGSNDTVSNILWGQTLFLENGSVVLTLPEVTITTEQETVLMSTSESLVKSALKSPNSAEFPGQIMSRDQWRIGRMRNQFSVHSYVDADNSFGASIRNKFSIVFTWDGDINSQPQVTEFVFNGEKVV